MDTMKIDVFLGQSESKGQIDGEIQLPVEKNDMEKIYNVCCTVNVREKSVTGDIIHVSGEAEFSIFYITAGGGIDSFVAISPFTHDIEAKGLDDECQVSLFWRVEDDMANILDPRTVKAIATVCFYADLSKGESLPSLDTAGLETRRMPVDSKYKADSTSFPFHTSTELRIPGGMEQVENIIGTRCYGVINGVKAEGQNAICFGDIFMNTLYSSGDDIWQICDSFPFEETVDCGISLDDKEIISAITIKKASATSYDPDVITYSVSAVLRLDVMGGLPLGIVVDAYSLTHDIETEKAHLNMRSPIKCEDTKYTYRATGPSEGITKPVCIVAKPIIKEEYAMEGSVSIEGVMLCDILHQKEDGRYDCTRVTLPMDENIPIPGAQESYDVRTTLQVQKAAAIISGDEMEIRCPLDAHVQTFSSEEYDVIQSADFKEPLNRDGSAIMIYFRDDDEDIFDIAKNHHIAMGNIIDDNDRKLILLNPVCR